MEGCSTRPTKGSLNQYLVRVECKPCMELLGNNSPSHVRHQSLAALPDLVVVTKTCQQKKTVRQRCNNIPFYPKKPFAHPVGAWVYPGNTN